MYPCCSRTITGPIPESNHRSYTITLFYSDRDQTIGRKLGSGIEGGIFSFIIIIIHSGHIYLSYSEPYFLMRGPKSIIILRICLFVSKSATLFSQAGFKSDFFFIDPYNSLSSWLFYTDSPEEIDRSFSTPVIALGF